MEVRSEVSKNYNIKEKFIIQSLIFLSDIFNNLNLKLDFGLKNNKFAFINLLQKFISLNIYKIVDSEDIITISDSLDSVGDYLEILKSTEYNLPNITIIYDCYKPIGYIFESFSFSYIIDIKNLSKLIKFKYKNA